MEQLGAEQISARLEALYRDLGTFPAGVSCPWPLARVVNELLRHTKIVRGNDPVIASIAALKADPDVPEISLTLVGAVRGLAAQAQVALGDPSAPSNGAKRAGTSSSVTPAAKKRARKAAARS